MKLRVSLNNLSKEASIIAYKQIMCRVLKCTGNDEDYANHTRKLLKLEAHENM